MSPVTTTLDWNGVSGKTYKFNLFDVGTKFKKLPGLYIFTRFNDSVNYWEPIYIGETDDFQKRLTTNLENHHRWDCINREKGHEHVCLHTFVGGDQARRNAEKDLRDNYQTPCNRQ